MPWRGDTYIKHDANTLGQGAALACPAQTPALQAAERLY